MLDLLSIVQLEEAGGEGGGEEKKKRRKKERQKLDHLQVLLYRLVS